MNHTSKSQVKRVAKRATYKKEEIYHILDKEFICHIGFTHNGYPVVIPTLYGRKDNILYIHGAAVSRMMKSIEQGIDICISVANVQGLVLARSAFHHSANYESVVLFGKGKLVSEHEKEEALKVISDHIIPDRWEEVRLPNKKELAITSVIQIEIDEVSGKVRTGQPVDDDRDYELDVWAGVLPIEKRYGDAITDPKLKTGIPVSESIQKLIKNEHVTTS